MSIIASDADNQRKSWSFAPRYRIEGTLELLSPLHIGGEDITHTELKNKNEEVRVNGHVRDHKKMPYIPGATLKGNIRAWLDRHGNQQQANIKDLFGDDASQATNGRGGVVEFHDAFLVQPIQASSALPYWLDETKTYLDASNTIDRHTGVAAEGKLFYREMVPAGTFFRVTITGNFAEQGMVELLLALLSRFSDHLDEPIRLGSNNASNLGKCAWKLDSVSVLDKNRVVDWLAGPELTLPKDAMRPHTAEQVETMVQNGNRFFTEGTDRLYTMPIELHFCSNFLVNNPPTKKELDLPEEQRPPNHRPLCNAKGEVYLPAKSFRGVVRSRAEKIVRTMGGFCCDPKEPCQAVYKEAEKERLCPVCLVFGAAGWRTPLEISDFTVIDKGEEMTQEFVAIDRFTGGGKDGAKFKAKSLYRPILSGKLGLDFHRLPDWGLGLLTLVLWDLRDEDLTFGFGASKGYGACRAEITQWDDEHFRICAEMSLGQFREIMAKYVETGEATWGDANYFSKELVDMINGGE